MMKRVSHNLIRATAVLIVLCSASPAQAALAAKQSIRALAAKILPASQIAVYAEPVKGGKPIVDINGDTPMQPASCVKMITAAAALSELGIDYRFRTEFLADTKPDDGSVDTLYIHGNGDPFITPEAVWRMAQDLVDHGYRKIEGDIVIDDTFFDGYDYPHKNNGGMRAWESPTGAVTTNFNVVEFVVTPAASGKLANVSVSPNSPYIRVVNKVKTGKRVKIGAARRIEEDHEIFIITGEIGANSKPATLARSVSRPVEFAGSVFARMLKAHDVEFAGRVRKGKVPEDAYHLFDAPSRPLALVVRDMNKFSNNFIAEQIVKHLGGRRSGRPGSTEQGLVAIREWLDEIGIDRKKYNLENGSGLSAHTRFTAHQLVKILQAAATDASIAPDFETSLAVLGVDGTMQHWHAEPQLRGILRAKTGTLQGTANLAGYIPDKDGNLIVFAIMTEGLDIGVDEARNAEVTIARVLAESR
jgi:D-alanyl-D-alanine carboxypeptidase/D-alanyl-D-alanine-endopeptidase (penicillin-binding protein 4)